MADLIKFTDTSANPESFAYTTSDISGKGVVGQADVPGLDAEDQQRKVEELVRKVVMPLINRNVDNTCTKDELAETVLAAGTVSAVFGRAGIVTAEAGDYEAAQVDYDHMASGLAAGDVQGAVDELKAAVDGKAASTHVHGNLTSDGKIGSTNGLLVVTGTGGIVEAKSKAAFGVLATPTSVTGTGDITATVSDNTEYSYTAVTSLTMTGAAVGCHGFITFAASAPTISVSGFTAAGGDDITEAAASEVWEFSVYAHNSGSYIVWKNWSA